MSENISKLCGLHAIYIAQAMLDDESRSVDELLRFFPNVRNEGISLNDAALFFRGKKYCASIQKMTPDSVLKDTDKAVYIVLLENKKQPHFILEKKSSKNTIVKVNFPDVREETVTGGELQKRNLALRISKEDCAATLSPEIILGILFFMTAALAWITFKRKKAKNA
jgi:hypothetical protein